MSTTEIPRLYFPPWELWFRFCVGRSVQDIKCNDWSLYIAEPGEGLVGEAIFGAVLGDIVDQFWEDGLEFCTRD